MGYHPETMICSFPPYPRTRKDKTQSKLGLWFYSLRPWIGFELWHIDPQKPRAGQRTDDSCGWFPRYAGEYDDAVKYLLADKEFLFEAQAQINRRVMTTSTYGHVWPRLDHSSSLALILMTADQLEIRRWWNGQNDKPGACESTWKRAFTKRREVLSVVIPLALDPLDNLSSVEDPESLIRLTAAALHRHFRPWWKHPRWHINHWKFDFQLFHHLNRMFTLCGTCQKPFGFNHSPCILEDGKLHHMECTGIRPGTAKEEL